jgi:hypothetical protein
MNLGLDFAFSESYVPHALRILKRASFQPKVDWAVHLLGRLCCSQSGISQLGDLPPFRLEVLEHQFS